MHSLVVNSAGELEREGQRGRKLWSNENWLPVQITKGKRFTVRFSV